MRSIVALLIVLASPCITYAQTISGNPQFSRTSGAAPLAVYMDARSITCSGNSQCNLSNGGPWRNLLYIWDYGDGTSSGTGNWTYGMQGSKNRTIGPIGGHVYENPGTYTITLSIQGPSGGTLTRTQSITVTDPDVQWSGNRTTCYSNNSDFTGCPSGSDRVPNTSSFSGATSVCNQTNHRCLFHAGHTFNDGMVISGDGPSMIGGFGSGRPIITTNQAGVLLRHQGANDWRITDFEFRNTDRTAADIIVSCGLFFNHLLIFNTKARQGDWHQALGISGTALDAKGSAPPEGVYVVGNEWRDFGFGSGGNIIFADVHQALAMGNLLYDSTGGEHVTRWQHAVGLLVNNNTYGENANTKGLLQIRARPSQIACSGGCGEDSQYVVASDNYFLQDKQGQAFNFTGAGKGTDTIQGADMIIERNFIDTLDTGTTHTARSAGTAANTSRATVRNNVIRAVDWAVFTLTAHNGSLNAGSDSSNTAFYNNTCYVLAVLTPSNTVARCTNGFASVYGNVLYAPNSTGTVEVQRSAGVEANNILASSTPWVSGTPVSLTDFAPKAGSQLIDAGGSPFYNPVDVTGSFRDANPDVGAFEFGSVAIPPSTPPPPDPDPTPAPTTDITIDHLVAYNPTDDSVLYDPFTGGAAQTLYLNPGFAICAVPGGTDVTESVRFILDGTLTGTESIEPFCQNDTNGDFEQYQEIVEPGTYTLDSVTPYTADFAGGLSGTALTGITLVVEQSQQSPGGQPAPPSPGVINNVSGATTVTGGTF